MKIHKYIDFDEMDSCITYEELFSTYIQQEETHKSSSNLVFLTDEQRAIIDEINKFIIKNEETIMWIVSKHRQTGVTSAIKFALEKLKYNLLKNTTNKRGILNYVIGNSHVVVCSNHIDPTKKISYDQYLDFFNNSEYKNKKLIVECTGVEYE